MANEAVLVIETEVPIAMTCSNATGIEKGTLLTVSDPFTVAATSADGDFCIGVAAEEKIASDGKTTIGVYMGGIFRVKDSGAGVTCGHTLKINGANLVATADEAGANAMAEIMGIALETAAASDTLLVRLR